MHAGKYDLSRNAEFQLWCESWAREAYRVMKPGGHLLAFGGSRTYHRLACAVEDAGFEIRDQLQWLYGSGFPKSHNLHGEWDGWGTALKPAHEPIVLARKPLIGTVSANVTEHGTGALNIDGTRIGFAGDRDKSTVQGATWSATKNSVFDNPYHQNGDVLSGRGSTPDLGRWPANVILGHSPECREVGVKRVKGVGRPNRIVGQSVTHDQRTYDGGIGKQLGATYGDEDGYETVTAWECAPDCAVALLDAQSGERKSGSQKRGPMTAGQFGGLAGDTPNAQDGPDYDRGYLDTGGASRFFYTAKASRAERNAGLEGMPERSANVGDERPCGQSDEGRNRGRQTVIASNFHPTVKPVALMRWLCRLITPPGGTVLDPFLGSGTTGIAAVLEGFDFIGVEQDTDYLAIAERRIDHWAREAKKAASLGPLFDTASD